jgi:tryptophan-rich sensory protein
MFSIFDVYILLFRYIHNISKIKYIINPIKYCPLFFKYHLINESLLLLLLIWILVFIIIDLFYSINKTAGLLLMPYSIWLTFALYLNYYNNDSKIVFN